MSERLNVAVHFTAKQSKQLASILDAINKAREVKVDTSALDTAMASIAKKADAAAKNIQKSFQKSLKGAANELAKSVTTSLKNGIKDRKVKLSVDSTSLKTGVTEANQALGNVIEDLQKKFATLGLAMQGVKSVARQTYQVVSAFTRPASTLQDLTLRFENMLGSAEAAATIMARIKEIAATTPFDVISVSEAAASLQAFGADAENTLKLIADLAAYMGTDIVYAAQAFGRAWAGGMGAADVLRERGIISLVKSLNGLEETAEIALPQFRELLISTLQNPAAGIAGATDKLSKSFTGAISNLSDAFIQFRATAGQALIDILQPLAAFARGILVTLNQYPVLLQAVARTALMVASALVVLKIRQIAYNIAKAVGVTLEGKWYLVAAAAAAGAVALGASLYKAAQRQEELNNELERGRAELESLESQFRQYRYLEELQEELRKARDAQRELYDEMARREEGENSGQKRLEIAHKIVALEKVIADWLNIQTERKNEQDKADAQRYNTEEQLYKKIDALDEYYSKNRLGRLEADLAAAREQYQNFGQNEENYVEERLKLYENIKKLEESISTERANQTKQAAQEEVKAQQDKLKELEDLVNKEAQLKQMGLGNYKQLQAGIESWLASVKVSYAGNEEFIEQAEKKAQELSNRLQLRLSEDKAVFVRKMADLANDPTQELKRSYNEQLADLNKYFDAKTDQYATYYDMLKAWLKQEEQKITEQHDKEASQQLSQTASRTAYLWERGAASFSQILAAYNAYVAQTKAAYGELSYEYQTALASLDSFVARQTTAGKATLAAIDAGWDRLWGNIIQNGLRGKNIMQGVWAAIRQSFLQEIGNMIAGLIRSGLIRLLGSIFTGGLFSGGGLVGKSAYFNAGAFKLATGGFVSGPGGPTDDAIPAWLSNGEFVVNAAATANWLPVLEAINSPKTPPANNYRGFAAGGQVAIESNQDVNGKLDKLIDRLGDMQLMTADRLNNGDIARISKKGRRGNEY